MTAPRYFVELLFKGLGRVPTTRHERVSAIAIHWNYATALNIVVLVNCGRTHRSLHSNRRCADAENDGGTPDGAHHHVHDPT